MSNQLDTLTVRDLIVATSALLPAGVVTNANVANGTNIATSKTVHRYVFPVSQAGGTAIADAEQFLHIFRGTTGTIIAIEAAIETAAAGDSTVDIDLELGTAASAFASVLSAAIQMTSSTAVRTPVVGTISSASATDGAILKLTIDATVGSGTLPQGLIVTVTVDETPA